MAAAAETKGEVQLAEAEALAFALLAPAEHAAPAAAPADPEAAGREPEPAAAGALAAIAEDIALWAMTEQIQNEFDKQGASDELFRHSADVEEGILRETRPVVNFSRQVRSVTLQFLEHLCQKHNLPPDSFFAAAALADAYNRHTPGGACVEALPATCVAIASLLRKSHTCFMSSTSRWHYPAAAQFAQVLRYYGYAVPEMSNDEVVQQEKAILSAVNWQIRLPTVESWMLMFMTRLNIVTRGLLMTSLAWVFQNSITLGTSITTQYAASPQYAPRELAAGLMALNCVCAGMFPVEALEFQPVEPWDQLFSRLSRQRELPTCVLEPAQYQRFLAMLQLATGLPAAALQAAAGRAARVLRQL